MGKSETLTKLFDDLHKPNKLAEAATTKLNKIAYNIGLVRDASYDNNGDLQLEDDNSFRERIVNAMSVNKIPETFKELIENYQELEMSNKEMIELIKEKKWGKELSDLQRLNRQGRAMTVTSEDATPADLQAIRVVRVLLSLCTNVCTDCGYEASVYNFSYCPMCGTKAVPKEGDAND